jgi:hypothetical protein
MRILKNRPNCTSVRLYTGMYNWTYSEWYFKAVMMVRLYMRPIICIDVSLFPICTVGPVALGSGIYFQQANCTQPNQLVQKVGRVDFRGRKLRKCTLPPGMASRVPIFALAQRKGGWGLYGSIVQGVSATCVFLACVRAGSTTSPRSLCFDYIYLTMWAKPTFFPEKQAPFVANHINSCAAGGRECIMKYFGFMN